MKLNSNYTVIIPTLNRPAYLQSCLQSIRKQTILPSQCIVVDQSDTEESKKIFDEFDFGSIKKVYVFQKQKSLIKARNNGLDQATNTDFISFLDDDEIVMPDFYEKLLARFANDTQKKYAGGMGTVAGSQQHQSFFKKLFFLSRDGDGRYLPNGMPTFPHGLKQFSEVEFLAGGMSLFRADLVKKFRYDERLIGYGYGDDVDITYRMSRKYALFIEPEAKLRHLIEAPGRDAGLLFRKRQYQNFYYLLKKNVGLSAKSLVTYFWCMFGQIIDDLFHKRFGAAAGTGLAFINILRDKLDSVEGYDSLKLLTKDQRS